MLVALKSAKPKEGKFQKNGHNYLMFPFKKSIHIRKNVRALGNR